MDRRVAMNCLDDLIARGRGAGAVRVAVADAAGLALDTVCLHDSGAYTEAPQFAAALLRTPAAATAKAEELHRSLRAAPAGETDCCPLPHPESAP